MEAAIASVPTVTEGPTEVEQVVEATSFGINKTNTNNTRHHFEMSRRSLRRALEILEGQTRGKTGTFATTLLQAEKLVNDAFTAIDEADGVVESVQADLAELWS